jgi:hypothetical protein
MLVTRRLQRAVEKQHEIVRYLFILHPWTATRCCRKTPKTTFQGFPVPPSRDRQKELIVIFAHHVLIEHVSPARNTIYFKRSQALLINKKANAFWRLRVWGMAFVVLRASAMFAEFRAPGGIFIARMGSLGWWICQPHHEAIN